MRIVVCGIGSKDRGDDTFGPYIVEHLREGTRLKKVDCGLYPENYLNKIIKMSPDLVLFLDTIAKGQASPILLRNEEILEKSPLSASTHSLPFSAVFEFLRAHGIDNIFFLGVPVVSYENYSNKVKALADLIISVLDNIDKNDSFDIISMYEKLSEHLR